MPTYTNKRNSSSHRGQASCPLRRMFLAFFVMFAACEATALGEDYAQPPQWTEDVKGVFFDDARKELKGEPPTQANAARTEKPGPAVEPSEQAVWRELISPSALESAVKATINRVAQVVRQPARFKAGLHSDCGRDLTLLGAVFEVIGTYPDEVRWKRLAPGISQVCLRVAESCAEGSEKSLEQTNELLAILEELLGGQVDSGIRPTAEPLVPQFAPLMQFMEFVVADELPDALSKPTQFRRGAVSIGEKAQLLAMLSQVICGEEYGYAADATYQGHADKLRDAARQLNAAATSGEFDKAVQAAAAIQKSCADCHADFRG